MELTGLADCLGAGVMGEGRAQSDVCISDLGGEGKGVHLQNLEYRKGVRLGIR